MVERKLAAVAIAGMENIRGGQRKLTAGKMAALPSPKLQLSVQIGSRAELSVLMMINGSLECMRAPSEGLGVE